MTGIQNNQLGHPFQYYGDKYRALDPLEIAARTGAPYSDARRVFTLTLMRSVYEVDYPEFAVHFLSGEHDWLSDDPFGRILLLRFLVNGRFIRPGGSFLAYQDIPWGEVYIRNFSGRCVRRLAYTFAGKGEQVARRMAALGGKVYEKGDIGWEFEFMPGLSIRFSIWNADEDFPPSAQILFSDNFHYAFDAEDIAYVGDVFIKILSYKGGAV